MTVEWAEFEIRRLPGVYAAIATPNEVVVLVEPGGDTAAVTDGAAMILQLLGIDQTLRVLGGGEPVAARPSLIRKVPVVVGVGGLVAVVLAGTVAALTGGLLGATSSPARPPVIPFPASPSTSLTVPHGGLLHLGGPRLSAAGPEAPAAAPHAVAPGPRAVALPFRSVAATSAVAQVIPHVPAAPASIVSPVTGISNVVSAPRATPPPAAPVLIPAGVPEPSVRPAAVTFARREKDVKSNTDKKDNNDHAEAAAHVGHARAE